MIRPALASAALLLAVVAFSQDTKARKEVTCGSQLLPSSTVAYVEVCDTKKLIATILDHPLRARIEALDPVKAAFQTEQYAQFRAVVEMIEDKTGLKWREAIETITEGGVYFGFDATTQGVALLARSSSEEKLKKIVGSVLEIARDNGGVPETHAYRGLTAYQVDQAAFALMGPWFVLVNKGDLGKAIADAYLDGPAGAIAGHERFKQARAALPAAAAWAYVDVGMLRDFGAAPALTRGVTDNPGAELLVGGILSILQKTPFAAASLAADKSALKLTLAAAHDAAWTKGPREYFFGPDGKSPAPPLLQVKDTLASLTAYRDISGMWINAADLFDENTNAGMAQAEGTLQTLFSGKDFGDDVLGAVGPEIQIVASRQSFADGAVVPAIKIPQFAAVFRLKDPEKSRADFRRIFQSLVGFLNIEGAMNGRPQLDQDVEKIGETQIVSATYAAEEKHKNSKEAPLNFNFSPSLAFAGNLMVLSSTKGLARELIEAAGKSRAASPEPVNTRLTLDAAALRRVLADNKENLVAQNMVDQGRSKEEAEGAIGMLLDSVGALRGASLTLAPRGGTLALELEVRLSDGK